MLVLILVSTPNYVLSEELGKEDALSVARSFLNAKLPEYIQIDYAQSDGNSEQSWAIRYDYDSSKDWELEPQANADRTSYDFGGSGYSLFAKGNYAFSENDNLEDYSEIGGSYKKRWFSIRASLVPLTEEQQQAVNGCLEEHADDFSYTVDKCREMLNFGRTKLAHIYLDLDVHAKVEGNQDFGERNYVYGFEMSFSAMPEEDSWLHAANIFEFPGRLLREKTISYLQLPIFTIGIEQVDPKEDTAREDLDEGEGYSRLYAQIKHTSPLGRIRGQPVKLNFSWRHFQELSPSQAIQDADLDTFEHYTVAVQLPSAIIPSFEEDKSRFVISYSSGELPFSRRDEEVFRIGWQSSVDFSELFAP